LNRYSAASDAKAEKTIEGHIGRAAYHQGDAGKSHERVGRIGPLASAQSVGGHCSANDRR
jgi:hypothetical protein